MSLLDQEVGRRVIEEVSTTTRGPQILFPDSYRADSDTNRVGVRGSPSDKGGRDGGALGGRLEGYIRGS